VLLEHLLTGLAIGEQSSGVAVAGAFEAAEFGGELVDAAGGGLRLVAR
jgi:hypothetical protein